MLKLQTLFIAEIVNGALQKTNVIDVRSYMKKKARKEKTNECIYTVLYKKQ